MYIKNRPKKLFSFFIFSRLRYPCNHVSLESKPPWPQRPYPQWGRSRGRINSIYLDMEPGTLQLVYYYLCFFFFFFCWERAPWQHQYIFAMGPFWPSMCNGVTMGWNVKNCAKFGETLWWVDKNKTITQKTISLQAKENLERTFNAGYDTYE